MAREFLPYEGNPQTLLPADMRPLAVQGELMQQMPISKHSAMLTSRLA